MIVQCTLVYIVLCTSHRRQFILINHFINQEHPNTPHPPVILPDVMNNGLQEPLQLLGDGGSERERTALSQLVEGMNERVGEVSERGEVEEGMRGREGGSRREGERHR